jgi:triacylglycerol lipase
MSLGVRNALLITLATSLCACVEGDDRETQAATTAAASSYTATRYPIVLLPGILGFEKLLGFVEYFPAIPQALEEDGAEVFVVLGSQVNSSRVRADQIIPQLEAILASTGASKLNLIAHSQGAIDARIIAAERPELVASLTSISGPHAGAPIADRVLDGSLTPLAEPAFGALGDMMTLMAGSKDPNDVHAAMTAMSTAGMAQFNAMYPAAVPTTPCGNGAGEVGGVKYYSWGGIGSLTNPLDLLDPVWVLGSTMAGPSNDGMIPRCSTHLGKVLRDDYRLNHIDETNMVAGLIAPFGPKPVALFRAHANRLRNEGL